MGLFGIGGNKLSSHDDIVLKKHKELLSRPGSIKLEGIAVYGYSLNGYFIRFRVGEDKFVRLDIHTPNTPIHEDDYFKYYYKGTQKINLNEYSMCSFNIRLTKNILNDLNIALSESSVENIEWDRSNEARKKVTNFFSGIDGVTIGMLKTRVIFEKEDNIIFQLFEIQQIYFEAMLSHLEDLNEEYEVFLQDEWTREFRKMHDITDLDPDIQEKFEILKEIEDNIDKIYNLSDRNIELRNKYFDNL